MVHRPRPRLNVRSLPPLAAVLASVLALPGPAAAQTAPAAPEARGSPAGAPPVIEPGESPSGTLWSRANLLGDPGGLRSALLARGITLGAIETAEAFGNPSGGVRQTAVFEGLLQLSLVIDGEKAIGLRGGTFNASAFQIHGRGLSANALANNLMTVSSLEAERGLLLFELWYEQAAFDGRASLRVGQQAADQEFMISQYAGLFLNHTFGWSTLPSADLPSGGPAYPLATPAVRLRLRPREDITVLAGVYNGDPAGPGSGTPQRRNPSGTSFRLSDDVLALLEVQYALNGGEGATGLAGTYKLGLLYHNGRFLDQRFNRTGESLADPAASNMDPRARRHDTIVYAVADQLLWRPAGEKDKGLAAFARIMGSPSDRNLVDLYVDAGLTWKGLLAARPDDTAGLAMGFAHIGARAAKLDRDARAAGTPTPIRRHETVLEATWQAQFAPWWQVQPTAQYVFNINGAGLDPARPGKRVPDAAVLGLRTVVTF